MELKTFMASFIINTLVSFAYPSSGQEDVDDKSLVNPGPKMDAVLEAISPASHDYNVYILENLPPKFTTKLMFRFYELKSFASQVSFRTNKVWDRCSAEVESQPSSSHDKIELS
ncbi:hypothetical protein N665_0157s0077 [Sinapis alba]|nr:hypothetical protein N665_0157s0077 [Sinapis alba]